MRLIVAIFGILFYYYLNPEPNLDQSITMGIAIGYGTFMDIYEAYYRGKLWVKNVD